MKILLLNEGENFYIQYIYEIMDFSPQLVGDETN